MSICLPTTITRRFVSKDDSVTHGNAQVNANVRQPPQRRQSSVVSTSLIKKRPNANKCPVEKNQKMVNQYVFERQLGQGAFASVHLCRDIETKLLYAIKKMNRKTLMRKPFGKNKSAYDCVKEEIRVMERLQHPNIIWLQEIIDDPKRDHIYLVTEYHSKGSLGDKVIKLNEP